MPYRLGMLPLSGFHAIVPVMSELRLNLVSRSWVIISKERGKRPEDFKKLRAKRDLPSYLSECPFCPGNESKTPPETFRIGAGGDWRVRVMPNKFPALSGEGSRGRYNDELKRLVTGVGVHEVIVEHPAHNANIALMKIEGVNDIIDTYRERFVAAYDNPNVGHVIIFKNHGVMAGTSLEHTHSQLIGSPVTPIQIRDRIAAYTHFYDNTGACLMCKTIEMEKKDGARLVLETEHFLTFIPYAAHTPFHTWLFPKRHSASFFDISPAEIKDLAMSLKAILAKIYHGLEDPSYNLVVRSNRPKDMHSEYYHWYVSIIPRTTMAAGFELGSGMHVNTSAPEDSAEFLRSVSTD